MKSEFGMIGIGVMGKNLSLNLLDHDFSLSVYDVDANQVDSLKNDYPDMPLVATYSLEDFVASLSRPRKIMIMVKAGKVTDKVLSQLKPLLNEGDVIIDGGNANFEDTERRVADFSKKDIYFIGTGISGGAKGARNGPSIMPGGNRKGWPIVKPYLQAIAATTPDGGICCQWIGSGGAGHYVKTIHNGIEYGDMQLIAEIYDFLRSVIGKSSSEISAIMSKWNEGRLNSYLVEITADILSTTDKKTGQPIIDVILDQAGQKGTGKWTAVSALELGIPATIIAAAVFQRFLSAQKEDRVRASQQYGSTLSHMSIPDNIIVMLETALYQAKLLLYSQGFNLLHHASARYNWNLDKSAIAKVWRSGCIIRSQFLDEIMEIFDQDPGLSNLLHAKTIQDDITQGEQYFRAVVNLSMSHGISSPALTAAVAYYDGFRSEIIPANLIQAQRDYFGSHGYQRVDDPSRSSHSTDWAS